MVQVDGFTCKPWLVARGVTQDSTPDSLLFPSHFDDAFDVMHNRAFFLFPGKVETSPHFPSGSSKFSNITIAGREVIKFLDKQPRDEIRR